MTPLKKSLAIVSLWLPAAAILITWILWRDRLPSELPSHWGASGPADAATASAPYLGWLAGIAAAAALVGTVLALAPIRGKWTQRASVAATGATAGYALAIWLTSAASSIDVTNPYTVSLGAWTLLYYVAPLYGLIQLLLLPPGDTPPVQIADAAAITAMNLSPSQSVAWSRTVSTWLFAWAAVALVVLGGLIYTPLIAAEGIVAVGWAFIPYIFCLLALAVFGAFRVTADWRGLRVTSLLLGIPLKRIAPEHIQSVEAAVLTPSDWGGWGYRIMPGRSAVILRRGPGLVVTQSNGKQFAITLDNPEQPAGVLLSLIAQRTKTQ